MESNRSSRRRQFAVIAAMWIVTVAAFCVTAVALLHQQVLLGGAFALLGSTTWFFIGIYRLEQKLRQRDPTLPPFFERLMVLLKRQPRTWKMQDWPDD
jgi:hypothetical protein